jgi:acyl-CoA synthetase (AMP-forming)/AMP-acid ligase II
VDPREIEAALMGHPKVLDVAVRGVPDPEWGERAEAVVQAPSPTDMTDALERELIAFTRAQIAPYKRPRAVRLVTTPLYDESGKLRRSVLDQLAAPEPE